MKVLYDRKGTRSGADYECPGGGEGDCPTTSDCDCDCDCPTDDSLLQHSNKCRIIQASLYEPKGTYQLSPSLIQFKLTEGYHVTANPNNSPGVVVLDTKASKLLSKFRSPVLISECLGAELGTVLSLVNAKLLVPLPVSSSNSMPPASQKTLVSWLHITNACPLGCKYCYINKSSEHMTFEIGCKAVDLVFQEAIKHGFKGVKLKYAGGEPSLNLDLVEKLHKLARQRATENAIELDEVFMTSGVMSTHARDRIINLGIRVMVSLDALNASHDLQRPLLSGKPSGEMTQDTLRAMKEAGVDICVSITVTRQNAKTLIGLIDSLLELDVPFSVNYARDNAYFIDRSNFKPQNEALIETMREVVAYLCQSPPKRPLLGALVDRANLSGPHNYTCAVGRNYLVIDHLGRISMCQQEMQTPITTILEPDPLFKIINNEVGIKNLSVHEKEGCRTCEWRHWCTGGCAALTTQVYGRADVRSPFCDVYKAIFPEVVRLEGLRLLQNYAF